MVERWRSVAAGSIIAGLAALLWVALVPGEPPAAPQPIPTTLPPTTTTTLVVSTSTTAPATSTTSARQREAEVQEILRELYEGWFEALNSGDPDQLWNVVATRPYYEAGVEAMDSPLGPTAAVVEDLDILLDRPHCLVVESTVELEAHDIELHSVDVLWSDPRLGWRFASTWKYADDLWIHHCKRWDGEP